MTTSYTTRGLAPPPAVSMSTMAMAGLLVDVYGLSELSPDATRATTCLWLLHPRLRTRSSMADIARRAVSAWNAQEEEEERGVLALAFDMPNHGSREVCARANLGWEGDNATHAIDMSGMVEGACLDMGLLMGLVGGYLKRVVDGHVVLGWSLGAHAAWRAVVTERRLDAAVVIVGCPDYTALLTDRAHRNGLPSPLIGTPFFPNSLLSSISSSDPASLLFGTPTTTPPLVPDSIPAEEQPRLGSILDKTLRGKRILCCSGRQDELVPYAVGTQRFLGLLGAAARRGGWYARGQLVVEDRVYEDAGHEFSAAMVQDALDFLLAAIAAGPRKETTPLL
ncbi:hypothetical protein CDD81_4862 [Ophiocordyceps australis]|uniref:AB hydrolase-1 domain-containing protein n=1 Tax=Ophiocordyceps australis TaxID=1399860 RepID=A0A2C5XIV5_9HYPO|nr:hypothetical protein CDD81_4862 [Ophiocordyceps australis]